MNEGIWERSSLTGNNRLPVMMLCFGLTGTSDASSGYLEALPRYMDLLGT